ncbi:heat shock factor-binding protein-like [Nicotiana tabacum]|uniref:Heat shock factor-binding protein-like n=2 Tax=Nicotiana TaxID=4085 RepID=A0A1S3ZX95_TOBAC|nr:PREDICTED: uncharacterized protein LOC104230699 [Nicotiana sylvestris]XP_016468963.1 PREDICTED: uncharacterized protein LOC107791417 [Nicotiana tabacum]
MVSKFRPSPHNFAIFVFPISFLCSKAINRSFSLAEHMDGHDADNTKQSTADMTVFVQNLLQQMQTRFQTMSESIISKIDEMGNRIDELEQSINDLRTEMGQEGSLSPSAALKSKDEPKSAEDST